MKNYFKKIVTRPGDVSLGKLKSNFKLKMQLGDPIFNYLVLAAVILLSSTFIIGGLTLAGKMKKSDPKPEKQINTQEISGQVWVSPPNEGMLQQPATYRLTAAEVAVRQEPTTSAPIIAKLQRGDQLTVLSRSQSGWVYVNLPNTDQYGYALQKYVFD